MTDVSGRAWTSPRRWPLSRIIGVALMILLLFSVAAIVAGGIALVSLQSDREHVVAVISPAALHVQELDTALVNQETGVRGYALSAEQSYLAPYTEGQAEEKTAIASLQAVIAQLPGARADLASVSTQAHYWRTHYAEPTISQVASTGKPLVSIDIVTGKNDFDALRTKVTTLQGDVADANAQAVAALNDSADVLDGVFIAVAAGLAAIVVLLAVGLRAAAI